VHTPIDPLPMVTLAPTAHGKSAPMQSVLVGKTSGQFYPVLPWVIG